MDRMEKNITMTEINCLSNMLHSDDSEIKDLGMVACKAVFGDDIWPLRGGRGDILMDMKKMLAGKAYSLGCYTGAQLLVLKANELWK